MTDDQKPIDAGSGEPTGQPYQPSEESSSAMFSPPPAGPSSYEPPSADPLPGQDASSWPGAEPTPQPEQPFAPPPMAPVTPPVEVVEPGFSAPPPPVQPTPVKKGGMKWWVILLIVLAVLCCCCAVVLGLAWLYGDQILESIEMSMTGLRMLV